VAVALDALLVMRGGRRRIEARQRERLAALVEHARHASPFYAEHYRDVPNGPVEPTRAGVEAFVGDLDTGEPALLVQDRGAVAVMTGLSYARSIGWFTLGVLFRLLVRGARQAALFATGGHFVTTTMTARRLRRHPVRRRFTRFLSVLEPLPRLVDALNGFRPALLASYASALAEGRTDEILRVPRPGGEPVALLPMDLATIVEKIPGVHRFQIVQRAPHRARGAAGARPGRGPGSGLVRDPGRTRCPSRRARPGRSRRRARRRGAAPATRWPQASPCRRTSRRGWSCRVWFDLSHLRT
jgi:hypothetical protein